MKIEIDLSDAAVAAIDRLEKLVERLETSANLALLIELAGKPVQPAVSADFGECVQIPLVPETGPEDGPPELVSDPDTASSVSPDGLTPSPEGKALTEGLPGFESASVADLAQPPKFPGRGHREKFKLWQRMRDYRQTHGLGCWRALAEKLGKPDEWVRSVYAAEIAVPVDVWRKIGAAIDQIEKEADGDG